MTRENAVSVSGLASLGISAESWGKKIEAGDLSGYVCADDGRMVGYCFGDKHTGEVLVLALLPEYEGRGIGRTLLSRVAEDLWSFGFKRLFLGCSRDPTSRSYGFYRHLGWPPTGAFDAHGNEVLELLWKDRGAHDQHWSGRAVNKLPVVVLRHASQLGRNRQYDQLSSLGLRAITSR
jgi:L-amino acid N-acyltransferase YncA